MIRFQFFPRSRGTNEQINGVINCLSRLRMRSIPKPSIWYRMKFSPLFALILKPKALALKWARKMKIR